MLGGNRLALEEIVSSIQTRLLCVDILAESLSERKKDCPAISSLIMDEVDEIEQFLSDVYTLISCEMKGTVIQI